MRYEPLGYEALGLHRWAGSAGGNPRRRRRRCPSRRRGARVSRLRGVYL